jgi:acyl carrier protein
MDLTILDKLTTQIREVTGNDSLKVTPSSRLSEDLGMDSVDFASLLMVIEEEFEGSIEDSQLTNVKTVEDVAELIRQHLA